MQPLDSVSWTGIALIIRAWQPVRGARSEESASRPRARPWQSGRIPGTDVKLRGDAVLVGQAAEPVGSLGPVNLGELRQGRVGHWDLKVGPTVRALIVVMLDELPQYPVEVSLAADEQPVQALGPGCRHGPLGGRVRSGRPHGCEDGPGAGRLRYLVEGPTNLASRSRTRDRTARPWSSTVITRCRACWVAQAPTGLAVTPAKDTFRRSRSMKNSS